MQSLEVGKGEGGGCMGGSGGVSETRKGKREAWSSENKVWGGRRCY